MANSLIFFDGFDEYTDMSQKAWGGSDTTISTSWARSSPGQGLKLFANNGNIRVTQSFTARAEIIVGFALKLPASPNNPTFNFEFFDALASLQQVSLTIDVTGQLRAYRGSNSGTLLGSASALYPLGTYHYFEARVKVNSSTGTIGVWYDGIQVLNLTGQNTQFSANASFGQVRFQDIDAILVDDFYLLDPTVGGAYSAPLGDVKIITSFTSGNGTQNDYTNSFAAYVNGTAYVLGQQLKDSNNNVQRCTTAGTATTATPTWSTTGGGTTSVGGGCVFTCVGTGSNPGSANWMAVGEGGLNESPDGDNSYVTDATVGHIDRYVYPAISGSAVKAVGVGIRADKDDAGTRSIRAAVKSGGTTADNGADFTLSLSTYQDFLGIFETDPNTSAAWSVSAANAAEYGIKTTA